MFHKLQKRLTLLYTITTGGILTAVLLVCFFYMKSSLEAKNEALFTSLFLGISGIFQTESVLSDTWLANAETANDLIIHIEDNGTPLFFPGSWEPRTQREELVKRAKAWPRAPEKNWFPVLPPPSKVRFYISTATMGILTLPWFSPCL